MTFQVRLAGICVQITARYDELYRMCRDYLDETALPEFCIELGQLDVEREAEINHESVPVTEERAPYLETLAAYRKIAEVLLQRDIILMHGSVVAVGNSAVMFTAPSGTGKTTHSQLWIDHVEGSYIVNGDKPLLRFADGIYACGTPWAGKEGYQKNCEVPLKAVCCLRRAEHNHIRRVRPGEMLPILMRQIYMPYDSELMAKTMLLMKRLASETAFYIMDCNNFESDAVTVSRNGITELMGE